jgi:hypothetical protein
MNDRQGREVTLLQAFETAQPPSPSWSEADRRWADRVAQEAVPADAPAATFIAARARHAMERLLPREAAARRWLGRAVRDGPWLAVVAIVAAGLGLFVDAIGNAQRINLLAPPFWGVLVWNLAFYVVLLATPLLALLRRGRAAPGPLQRAMLWLLRGGRALPTAGRGAAASAAPLAEFGRLWAERSARIASLRAQTLLHVGAAALALGLIGGLYVRGLVLDFRVGWESTFLTPPVVHALLATLLSPASILTGIPLPDADGIAALQTQPGGRDAGAPAAAWIHLLALTMLAVVVVPRLVLGFLTAALARHRRRRFALPLDSPYFQRLARLQRGGAAAVEVHPYAHVPSPQAVLGLQALLADAFAAQVAVRIAPTAAFGAEDDDSPPPPAAAGVTHALLLCDLAATPEAESQGRFARRLAGRLPPGAVLALLVDESAFRRRFAGLEERTAQRRAAWTKFGEALGTVPVFADLEAPVDAPVVQLLQDAFARPVRPGPDTRSAVR